MPLAMSRPVMPLGIVPTRAVGKGQRDHHSLLLLTRCLRMQVSVAGRVLDDGGVGPGGTAACLKCKRGHDLYDGPKRCNDCIAELLAPSARSRRRGVDGIIGPAPAPIAPGQVPARMVRERRRHEIEPGGPERMAAAEPRQRHPPAGPQAEASDRLIGIAGAGRQMAAMEPDQRGEGVAIERRSVHARPARKPDRCGDDGPEPLVGTSLVHRERFHPATTSGCIDLNCGNARRSSVLRQK